MRKVEPTCPARVGYRLVPEQVGIHNSPRIVAKGGCFSMKRNSISRSGRHKIRSMPRGELRDRLIRIAPFGSLLPRADRPLAMPNGGGTRGY